MIAHKTSESDPLPVIVFLHGWGAAKEIWLPLFQTPLVDRYRLIALDLPGVGGAKHQATNGSCSEIAKCVAARITQFGVEHYVLVGHSQGANVASWLASRYPERVTHLVLVGAALYTQRLERSAHYLNPKYGRKLLAALRLFAGFAGYLEALLPPDQGETLGWTRGYMRRMGYVMFANDVPQLVDQLRGLVESPFDITTLPPELPVLLIHGAKDSTIPVDHAHEMHAKRTDNTHLHIYETALHCPMDTHLARFVQDISVFLDI